jgi:pimeloyl-ACP methyl ester carboxylesterase
LALLAARQAGYEGRVRTFQTSFGPVPVRGDLARFEASRPIVMVIRGAFPDPEAMTLLQGWFPDADVVIVDLPGMHSPFFEESSIAAFAAAFDEILAEFDRRQAVAVGISTGALAAFAMRRIARLIAIEPPLSTAAAWPLVPNFRERALESADLARWIEAVFGISPDRIENRDYTGLVDSSAPGVVMVGETPLEPMRPFERMPSLVAAPDRAKILAQPHLSVMTIPGAGHNVPGRAPTTILSVLRQILGELAAAEAPSDLAPGR